jgi:hypothetical protein
MMVRRLDEKSLELMAKHERIVGRAVAYGIHRSNAEILADELVDAVLFHGANLETLSDPHLHARIQARRRRLENQLDHFDESSARVVGRTDPQDLTSTSGPGSALAEALRRLDFPRAPYGSGGSNSAGRQRRVRDWRRALAPDGELAGLWWPSVVEDLTVRDSLAALPVRRGLHTVARLTRHYLARHKAFDTPEDHRAVEMNWPPLARQMRSLMQAPERVLGTAALAELDATFRHHCWVRGDLESRSVLASAVLDRVATAGGLDLRPGQASDTAIAYTLAESGVYTRLLGADITPSAFLAEVEAGPLAPWLGAAGNHFSRDDHRIAMLLWRGVSKSGAALGLRDVAHRAFWRALDHALAAQWKPFLAGLWGDRAAQLMNFGSVEEDVISAQTLASDLAAASGSRRRLLVELTRSASIFRRLGAFVRAQETLDRAEQRGSDLLEFTTFEPPLRASLVAERRHLQDRSTAAATETARLT